jgi:hypothetical protein
MTNIKPKYDNYQELAENVAGAVKLNDTRVVTFQKAI